MERFQCLVLHNCYRYLKRKDTLNKEITIFLLQLIQTILTIAEWFIFAAIGCKITYKTLKDFFKKIGLKRPHNHTALFTIKNICTAYLFTIAVYVVLKVVNGGMSLHILARERDVLSTPLLLITILLMGLRSGIGEGGFMRSKKITAEKEHL